MWIHLTESEIELARHALHFFHASEKTIPSPDGGIRAGQMRDLQAKIEAISSAQPDREEVLSSGEMLYGAEASELQAIAFERYDSLTDGNINYDTNSIVCRAEHGAYAMGWIYVSNMEIEEAQG